MKLSQAFDVIGPRTLADCYNLLGGPQRVASAAQCVLDNWPAYTAKKGERASRASAARWQGQHVMERYTLR